MTIRSFALLAFSVLSLAAGCSANAEDSAAASADMVEAPKNELQGQTIVRGSVSVGETSTVAYEPLASDEYLKINGVPYLAWAVDSNSPTVAINVQGNFPSTPEVLLVDAQFNLLGQTHGSATELGDVADLIVHADPGKKFVLVRDMDWVRPMDFEISVAQ